MDGENVGFEFLALRHKRGQRLKNIIWMDYPIIGEFLFPSISFTLKSKPLIQLLNYNPLSKKLPDKQ